MLLCNGRIKPGGKRFNAKYGSRGELTTDYNNPNLTKKCTFCYKHEGPVIRYVVLITLSCITFRDHKGNVAISKDDSNDDPEVTINCILYSTLIW